MHLFHGYTLILSGYKLTTTVGSREKESPTHWNYNYTHYGIRPTNYGSSTGPSMSGVEISIGIP